MNARNEHLGRLIVSDGCAVFTGTVSDTSMHAHYAVQLTLMRGAPFQVRTRAGEHECGAAIIPSRQAHAVQARGNPVLLVYLDPTARRWERVAASCGKRGIRTFDARKVADYASALERVVAALGGEVDAITLVDRVVASLVPDTEAAPKMDARVRRVLSILDGQECSDWQLTDLAARVALSPDRLRHLFSDQLGISIRSYKSWARVRRAIPLLTRGGSLTEVAHASGFVDAAHLSRAFREMFGITPSELAQSSVEVR